MEFFNKQLAQAQYVYTYMYTYKNTLSYGSIGCSKPENYLQGKALTIYLNSRIKIIIIIYR